MTPFSLGRVWVRVLNAVARYVLEESRRQSLEQSRTATLIFDAFQRNFQTLAAQSYQTTQAGGCVP